MSHLTEEMDNPKPIILLLGEIVLAHKEWDALRAIAELRAGPVLATPMPMG